MWLGGTRGLGRIRGDMVDVVSQPDDLPGYGVFAITEDADGYIWLGVSSGIVRLEAKEFERAARQPRSGLSYRIYDASDGLVGVPARQGFPGVARHSAGTLLFTTSQGASVIHPRQVQNAGTPAPLRIERVTANDQGVALTQGASLAPGTSRLLVEYTAVNLTSPMKDRFRYRLEGVDADWVDAGTRREAFYSNLRAGDYQFRVTRLSSDETAGQAATTWGFSIRPMYYETWWFMTGCAGLVGLMAWAAWRLRLQQLRRQFALVFAERARMSRELHDTLLQDLVGITLHFDELAATLGEAYGTASGQAVRLRRYLERAIGEARQTVWDLRSEHPEGQDVPAALRESGERVFAGRPTNFEMVVTGQPRPCAPAIERHLLRIAREALCNAARYADATSVTLKLDYLPGDVVLRVSDNGRGCQQSDYSGHRPGHYGFLIMKERADQVGGRFEVAASPETGTAIEVTIPA
jgi:signal transduction histidine kinase